MVDRSPHLWLVARVHAPDEGGVQTYVTEVALAYAALGWRVTVFAKSSAGPRRTSANGVDLIDVGPASRLQVYLRLCRAMLVAWYRGDRPAAIHACTWRAALPALFFPRPLIVTIHGREVGRPGGAAFMLLHLVLRRAHWIVAVSAATRAMLIARLPALASRCKVAWNGVHMPPDRAPTSFQQGRAAARVLSVCRLVARKNIPAAIDAAAACVRRHAPLHYCIVGRGVDSIRVQQTVRRHALEETVTLAGYVSDAELAAEYHAADIFLHPQIALEDGAEMEGFGLSVADAMAQGLACIVGQDGGPAELVQDGVTGLVVDGRSPQAILDALAMLARDPALCQRLGRQARQWAASHLCWEQHCSVALGDLAGVGIPNRLPVSVAQAG